MTLPSSFLLYLFVSCGTFFSTDNSMMFFLEQQWPRKKKIPWDNYCAAEDGIITSPRGRNSLDLHRRKWHKLVLIRSSDTPSSYFPHKFILTGASEVSSQEDKISQDWNAISLMNLPLGLLFFDISGIDWGNPRGYNSFTKFRTKEKVLRIKSRKQSQVFSHSEQFSSWECLFKNNK